MLFFDDKKIEEFLKQNSLVNEMEKCLSAFSQRNNIVSQPPHSAIAIESRANFFSKTAYSKQLNCFGVKNIATIPENPEVNGLPYVHSLITLFDSLNGLPFATLDGNAITAYRTAAVSAVATKLLAQPSSKVLALVGAGVQASSHFEILNQIYHFEHIQICSRTFASAKRLAQKIGNTAKAVMTTQEAVDGADIICTVSASAIEKLEYNWCKPGCHVNVVNSITHHDVILENDFIERSKLYVESNDNALKSGDVNSMSQVYAEIGEVLLHHKNAFVDEITVFMSHGMGLEDLYAAKFIYDHIQKN